MRKKIEPRFPESLEKLRQAIKVYGNTAKLARLSGVSVSTIANLTREDNPTRFPWSQTVEALWQVLPSPETVAEVVVVQPVPEKKPAISQGADRRARRYGKQRHVRASKRRIARPVRVLIGTTF